MSADLLHRLDQIGRATLRLSASLERLPLERAAPAALMALAIDPGALLDECLAPLMAGVTPPPADDDHDERATDLPARPVPAHSSASASGARPQPRLEGHVMPQAPHVWERAPQLDPAATPWSQWDSASSTREPAAAPWSHWDSASSTREQLPSDGHTVPAPTGAGGDDRATATPLQHLPAPLGTPTASINGSARHGEVDTNGGTPGRNQSAGGPASANSNVWRGTTGINGDGAPQGLRIARGAAELSALLRANIRQGDAMAAAGGDFAERPGAPNPVSSAGLGSPLPRPSGWDDAPDRERNERAEAAAPGATPHVSRSPEITLIGETAARPTTQDGALDIDAIMRELADRLEFEYMRMYGTSGD
jgi:hypothetical protein